jgi:hypothetical protein
MATTTNYGWTTPDDTALVKDGASAIRTLGSSVDTTTKALNPSTTLGDIEYRSSTANTNTRLGIGTTGQVLAVSGGVPAWSTVSSGGMTLLSTTTLSGASTITVSSISQSYTNLMVVVFGVTNATSDSGMSMTPNANSGVSDYMRTAGATSVATNVNDQPGFNTTDPILRTSNNNAWTYNIYNYSSTTAFKNFNVAGGYLGSSSSRVGYINGGIFRSTTAISSLQFDHYGGTFSTGTVLVYGVK